MLGVNMFDSICLSVQSNLTTEAKSISKSNSLEAKHLMWVWIMKVKGPQNQADFLKYYMW